MPLALLGGAGRINRPARLGNTLICNFRTTGLSGSRHVDGDFFVHHPDSPQQALLLFVLWTDVAEGKGATQAAPSATAGIPSPLKPLTRRLLGQPWTPQADAVRQTFVPGRIGRRNVEGTCTDRSSVPSR
jgi:hypothetical protein